MAFRHTKSCKWRDVGREVFTDTDSRPDSHHTCFRQSIYALHTLFVKALAFVQVLCSVFQSIATPLGGVAPAVCQSQQLEASHHAGKAVDLRFTMPHL